jgi:hypothetical protein
MESPVGMTICDTEANVSVTTLERDGTGPLAR